MTDYMTEADRYHRYHIEAKSAPDLVPWPSRFKVKVNRPRLALLLLKEVFQYRGDPEVVLSRPCIYGVFSGPIGGFLPRERECVGCLRCTTQYPEMVEILRNPARDRLGDSFFTSQYVNAIAYEAATGRIPVKGAGYRGLFGGEGWDGIWTDMSEIVRPTRDGIHGREFISMVVDIGTKPNFLVFDAEGQPNGSHPQTFSLPIPFLFDAPPIKLDPKPIDRMLGQTAQEVGSLAILPLEAIRRFPRGGEHLVPLVQPSEKQELVALKFTPRMIEMDGWDEETFHTIQRLFPKCVIALRLGFDELEEALSYYDAGVRVFHFTANYHGHGPDGTFVHDLIRNAHQTFVDAGCRDTVTLLGSGGIIAAEHVAKAIIAGLDAVVLDTALLVALQAHFQGDCVDRATSRFLLPDGLTEVWGVQRLKNLAAAWRDQLLEVLGAMGLREVRRLRGETGRVMYQNDLEQEAFAGIEGYHG